MLAELSACRPPICPDLKEFHHTSDLSRQIKPARFVIKLASCVITITPLIAKLSPGCDIPQAMKPAKKHSPKNVAWHLQQSQRRPFHPSALTTEPRPAFMYFDAYQGANAGRIMIMWLGASGAAIRLMGHFWVTRGEFGKRQNKNPLTPKDLGIRGQIKRRGWDSNPRNLSAHRFSRPARSTALSPLQITFARARLYGRGQ